MGNKEIIEDILNKGLDYSTSRKRELKYKIKKALEMRDIEVEKTIDEEIKKEENCMKDDQYEEQILEHTNQIEMANKIKLRLGGK